MAGAAGPKWTEKKLHFAQLMLSKTLERVFLSSRMKRLGLSSLQSRDQAENHSAIDYTAAWTTANMNHVWDLISLKFP